MMCGVSWLEVFAPYKPRYAASICWMNNKHASLVFFLLPVAALLAENFLLFLVTVYGIHSSRARDLQQQPAAGTSVKFAENVEDKKWCRQKNRIYFIIYLKLSLIMGLTWTFGFLASFLRIRLLWYPFIVFNSLQGAFIFVFFDVKWKVYFTAYEKVMGKSHPRKNQHLRRTLLRRISRHGTNTTTQTGLVLQTDPSVKLYNHGEGLY